MISVSVIIPSRKRIVLNASTAVALSGGEWFLGVINREAEDQVTYRVRAAQSVDVPATPLQNEIWVTKRHCG